MAQVTPINVRSVPPPWFLLQVSDVLDLEFASALSALVPVVAFRPSRSLAALRTPPGAEPESPHEGNSLRIRALPLVPGFSRLPRPFAARAARTILQRLTVRTPDPTRSPLICTTPWYAPVAELWPGPVLYWLTDLIAEYAGARRSQVIALDRRLCRVATLVCPNSQRLSDYLVHTAACPPERILIVPNATRASNLLPTEPGPHPAPHPGLQHIPRPIAGIIGNLAGNMDWLFIESLLTHVPALSWVFVGPTSMPIPQRAQRLARARVLQHPRAHFVGPQPYGALAAFARAFDIAILPYRRCEPTYSGSSTRFYEHLAACRPMIATRGLEELTRKPPLLRLVDTAPEAITALNDLLALHCDDGYIGLRWQTSRQNTWSTRAHAVVHTLAERLHTPARTLSSTA